MKTEAKQTRMPSDIAMENIASLDILTREWGENSPVVERFERAVNSFGLLLETAKQAVAENGDCSCADHKCLFCLAQEAIQRAEKGK